MRKTLIGLLAAATLTLAGCGSSDHNDADVAFATDMVPHHAQALDMVKMTEGHTLDPAVQKVVAGIDQAQTPEITTMSGWLKDWDEKVPSTSGGMSGMSGDMPGMMSGKQMDQLDKTADPAFQKLWLQLMIEHHTGAIEMAKTEIADGKDPAAIKLAKSIASGQAKEVATMKGLLAS